ncbi:MAG: zinc ribbon domain-containing protein [Oscillospiraceae bacterium]|jgi:ribosomal protein L40E|nr:zinc ribbon domain-containing protein [Oscillospiraceae bacterium]
MGLFEDVMINAKNAASVVGEKAGQLVDISKLRINAADLNNEIGKRFEALGRVVYDSHKTGSTSDELVDECVDAIDELYEQLDAVNEQLAAKRSHITCKECGQENPVGAAFCIKCGAKLQSEAAEAPQNTADSCGCSGAQSSTEKPAEQNPAAPEEKPAEEKPAEDNEHQD